MAENKCDELFGKNGELVEFRKKQVLEGAFEIIQRHYKGKPNKMEMVSAIFGNRLQFRVQPISRICKRMRRHREIKQREQEFAEMVRKVWGKAEKKKHDREE